MDLEQIRNIEARDLGYMGARLKQIRLELKDNYQDTNRRSNPFTAKNIAEYLNVDRSVVDNVERGTSLANSLKFIIYYHTLGYNPSWVIVPDNSFIPKQNVNENTIFKTDVQQGFKDLQKNISDALEGFKENL